MELKILEYKEILSYLNTVKNLFNAIKEQDTNKPFWNIKKTLTRKQQNPF